MQTRRILSIDVLRGLGIMVIIVIHRIHYTWTGMRNPEILKAQFSGPWGPVIIFTIALFTMAGIFYFISGLVNAYSMYARVSSGKSTATKAMMGGIAGGFWIFLMNYVQRIFFMNGFIASEPDADPRFPVGLLTGWVRNSQEVSFSWTQVADPGTLSLIGLIVIFVSLMLGLMLNFQGYFTTKKIYIFLFTLAVIAFLASPFSKFYLRPVYNQLFETGSLFNAACLGHVCQEFGLLPYLGYGFIGAIFGISIASGGDMKKLSQWSYKVAICIMIVGALSIVFFDRTDTFGRGCIGSGICLAELGIFILLQFWLMIKMDKSTPEKYEKRRKKTVNIRRFGMLALTVYILEPIVAEVFRKIIDQFLGSEWNNELQYVLLFGFLLLLFWWMVLKLWQKVGFKGSFEWITGVAMLKLAGKTSGKVSFKDLS